MSQTRCAYRFRGGSTFNLSSQSAAAPDGTGDFRSKIVEILSSTANGCLSELGYFPGMTQQLQQTLQANARLETKNTKLYEDNRSLARIASTQNDRLSFLGATDSVKLQQFMEMKDQLQSLAIERAELQRSNEALSKGMSMDHGYQTLVSELQALRVRHENLQRDHAFLRNNYTQLYSMAVARGILHPEKTAGGQAFTDQTQMQIGNPLFD